MRTVFFGTPALAVPYLEFLAQQTELKGVVTTPDEPAGRGYETQPTPVKQAALKFPLPVLQPDSLTDPQFLTLLRSIAPDLAVVVAYGKILPADVLSIAAHGFINVHFSLLPAYRGAAPIQRALMNGEKQTGVTLFWLDEGMDTGPVFLQKNMTIAEEDDAESLRQKLIPLGVNALKEALDRLSKGQAARHPQAGAASKAPSLTKDDGRIDWTRSAAVVSNLIRGTYPWPGAFTFVTAGGKSLRLKVLKAKVVPVLIDPKDAEGPGAVVHLEHDSGFIVKCGREFLHILQVQPEGKRPMSAWDFWQGARMKIGDKIG
ncbi:MAG: methionyl-tRNA formyltransferase [Elusimicrobia bacterium RIFCSPLOWO2_01_FULL_59_12]|nr:MAG: methionyl-tRNA formyltransferase [Elusimicrobia bacterium RIFCSPLOWO2_01_FULL_59_12]